MNLIDEELKKQKDNLELPWVINLIGSQGEGHTIFREALVKPPSRNYKKLNCYCFPRDVAILKKGEGLFSKTEGAEKLNKPIVITVTKENRRLLRISEHTQIYMYLPDNDEDYPPGLVEDVPEVGTGLLLGSTLLKAKQLTIDANNLKEDATEELKKTIKKMQSEFMNTINSMWKGVIKDAVAKKPEGGEQQ